MNRCSVIVMLSGLANKGRILNLALEAKLKFPGLPRPTTAGIIDQLVKSFSEPAGAPKGFGHHKSEFELNSGLAILQY